MKVTTKVDIDARKNALSLICKLEAQVISIQKFEDDWPLSQDTALNGILRWLWTLYSDDDKLFSFKLLSDKDKKTLGNCKAFLESNQELPMKKLTLTSKFRERLKWGKEWNVECSLPHYEEWPFPKKNDS